MRGGGGQSRSKGVLDDVGDVGRHGVEGLLNTEVPGESCRRRLGPGKENVII